MTDMIMLLFFGAVAIATIIPMAGVLIQRREDKPYDEWQVAQHNKAYRDTLFVMIAMCAAFGLLYGIRNSYGMVALTTPTVVLYAVTICGFSIYNADTVVRNAYVERQIRDPFKSLKAMLIMGVFLMCFAVLALTSKQADFSLPVRFSIEVFHLGLAYYGLTMFVACLIRRHLDRKEATEDDEADGETKE